MNALTTRAPIIVTLPSPWVLVPFEDLPSDLDVYAAWALARGVDWRTIQSEDATDPRYLAALRAAVQEDLCALGEIAVCRAHRAAD